MEQKSGAGAAKTLAGSSAPILYDKVLTPKYKTQ